jgi:hypothetical protein
VELVSKAPRRFSLRFGSPATYQEAANLLFLHGTVPKGLTIAPSGSAGTYSDRWDLTWTGSITSVAPQFTPALVRVLEAVALGSVLTLTPEETAAYNRALEEQLKYRLDFLGMTAGEAFKRLEPGGHEINGYFVFVGHDPNHPGGTSLEWCKVSKDNETFNRDIRYYLLKKGLSLSQSIWAFTKQWREIANQILGAFALALASPPGGGFGSAKLRSIRDLDTVVEVVTTAYAAYEAVKESLTPASDEDKELADEVQAILSAKSPKGKPGRAPKAAMSSARRSARAEAIAGALESLRAGNPTPQAAHLSERLEAVYGREAVVKFMDTGKLPKGIEFSHLFSAAEYPEFARRGDLGVLTDEGEHRIGHHGGDTRVPLHGKPRSSYRR